MRLGVRVLGQPLGDPEAFGAHGVEEPAPVGQLRRLDDAGHGPDPEPHVAAAHLLAPLDEHDPELPVPGQAVLHQRPVAGLEDVQRQVGERAAAPSRAGTSGVGGAPCPGAYVARGPGSPLPSWS